MLEGYKTILSLGKAEIIEKKSKFIATASPVETENEAIAFISDIKKQYWDATHNVFAYQIGQQNEVQKCSDDGEPNGTAGKPVLDVLIGENIKNAVVVVTRYFGGTLLGTGGLVRAYGKCAKLGIEASFVVEKILYKKFEFDADYNLIGKIQYELLQNEYKILNIEYTDRVKFTVLSELKHIDKFKELIKNITSAHSDIVELENLYGTLVDGKLQLK